jgi:predicted alpha/beta-fold hydrolase
VIGWPWFLGRRRDALVQSLVVNGHTEFRPLRFLGNRHVQTVLGFWWRGRLPGLPTRERRVELPDGDRLVLHESQPAVWQPGEPIALLVHGLGGCHLSGYLMRLAGLLWEQGVRVVRMDLRGCGRGALLARRSYHGGCSEDVRAAAAEIHRWDTAAPLSLIGFSLGGNIVLKLAGEAAERPVPGLECVAAVAPPIDLERCAELIALRRNRLYELHFLRVLLRQLRQRQRFLPELRQVRFPRRLTLRIFDDLFTAPQHGFADALDYYRRASSLPVISRIGVPALILTARDDPFIAVESFENLKPPGHITLRIVPRGGHLGFLGWDGAGGVRWAERRVAEWVLQQGHQPEA